MTMTNDIITYRQRIDNLPYVYVMPSEIMALYAKREMKANIRCGLPLVTGRYLELLNKAAMAKAMETYEAHMKSKKEAL